MCYSICLSRFSSSPQAKDIFKVLSRILSLMFPGKLSPCPGEGEEWSEPDPVRILCKSLTVGTDTLCSVLCTLLTREKASGCRTPVQRGGVGSQLWETSLQIRSRCSTISRTGSKIVGEPSAIQSNFLFPKAGHLIANFLPSDLHNMELFNHPISVMCVQSKLEILQLF